MPTRSGLLKTLMDQGSAGRAQDAESAVIQKNGRSPVQPFGGEGTRRKKSSGSSQREDGAVLARARYNGRMAGRPVDRYIALLHELLPDLAEKYHVRSLEVFGSYVRDEQTPESDLDVLVTFDEAPGLFQYIELESFLADTLGIKVDLVMKSALKPRIGQNILREAVPV